MAFYSLTAFLLVSHLVHNSLTVLLTMKGYEYITYDVTGQAIASEQLRVVFKFKTIDPSGLLLFSENLQYGDFISLELIDGRLRYKARLGFEDSSAQELVIGNDLNNYNWHVVDVRLHKRNVTIELNQETTFKAFSGEFSRLDLNLKVFIGGIDDNVDVSPYKITNRKYSGCLKNFFFNDIDMLYKAKFSKPRFKTTGDLMWNQCEELNYQPIMMSNPQDYALLPTFLKNSLLVTFHFRTHIGEGLLFAKISPAVTVYLGLQRGILLFSVQIRGQGPIVMTKGEKLNDGFWHRVEFLVSKDIIKLNVDKKEATHSNPWAHLIEFVPGNATLGGGEEQIMQGFVGCMYYIWVDNTYINYYKFGADYFVGALKKCELQDKCIFSPCHHGGICSQNHLTYTCDCMNSMYSGSNCQESIYQTSCQEYKNLGLNEDAFCYIDPDQDGQIKPFKVLCNMTSDEKMAVTVIKHNLETNYIPVNKGKVSDGSFHHLLKYGIDLETFDVLLQKASKCRQHVGFKCHNSFLLRSPRGPPDTVWTGRLGNYENYWGGASPGSGMCACGKNRSCAHPFRYCNCDIGDDVVREDAGFFTQIDRLPVVMINFKLSSNQSFFSVGNLECEFNSTHIPKNLSKVRVLKACTPVNFRSTARPLRTEPTLNQKERIINWNRDRVFEFGKPTQKLHIDKPIIPNVNVNVTVELPHIKGVTDDKKRGRLKIYFECICCYCYRSSNSNCRYHDCSRYHREKMSK